MLDWSKCAAVERVPGRVSEAWLFKGTRVPVAALFENLEGGATVDDLLEWFQGVTREQVEFVLKHAEQSLTVTKRGGKEFQLTRTDSGKRDINAQMDQLFKDIPPEAPRVKTDLVRVLLEDRECQDTIAFALGMKA